MKNSGLTNPFVEPSDDFLRHLDPSRRVLLGHRSTNAVRMRHLQLRQLQLRGLRVRHLQLRWLRLQPSSIRA